MGMSAVEEAMRRSPQALRHRLEYAEALQSVEDIRRVRKLGMLGLHQCRDSFRRVKPNLDGTAVEDYGARRPRAYRHNRFHRYYPY